MPDLTKNQMRDIKIDIYDVMRDLIKDWWLIILIGISTAMCAYIAANLIYEPTYATSATFVVTTKGSNDIYTNLSAANTVAETFTNIFSSSILKKKVAEDIGYDYVPGMIKAKVINETNLFELTVSASKPDMAYRIITSIMENYTSITNNVFGNAILDVLEAPEIPMRPNNTMDYTKIMRYSFCLGVVAMSAVLMWLSITRDNIKNESQVAEKLDSKLFGVVYHENKYKTLKAKIIHKRKSILITSPTVSFSFVESIKRMRSKLEYKLSENGSKVLLITSLLENEGKSTIATNLAISLAQKSFNVLLVDADFCKPSVYKILDKNVEKEQEIGECIIKKGDLKDALSFDETTGLYLLIGSRLYKNSTDLIAREPFEKLIHVSKKIMDFIIIDAPPISVSVDTEILADIADVSLLVIKQSTARTKSINDAIDYLAGSNSELLGCVYNNVHMNALGRRLEYGNKYSNKYYYGNYDTSDTSVNI